MTLLEKLLVNVQKAFDFENEVLVLPWALTRSLVQDLQEENQTLQKEANRLQCLEEAGIDNVEAYSIGMQLYFERYPEEEY